MPSISITAPATGGTLPATITGAYSLGGTVILPLGANGGIPNPPPPPPNPAPPVPSITVIVISLGNSYCTDPLATTITADTTDPTRGTWTCPRPSDVMAGNDHIVVATLLYGSARKSAIASRVTYP